MISEKDKEELKQFNKELWEYIDNVCGAKEIMNAVSNSNRSIEEIDNELMRLRREFAKPKLKCARRIES